MKKTGFSIVELLIVIVVVGIIGAVGYVGYNTFTSRRDAQTAATSQQATPSTPVTIQSNADLDAVDKQLDALSVDDSDSAQLDASTSGF